MSYGNYGAVQTKTGFSSAPPVMPEIDLPSRKELDVPKIETKVQLVVAKKDGKVWVMHQTIITDWKPGTYYETAITCKRTEYAQNGQR